MDLKPCSFPTCRAGLHHFSPLPLLRSEHCLHDKQPLSIYAHVRWGGLFAVAWWVTPPQRADLPSGYSPPCCGWRVWASSLAAVTLAPRAVSGRPGVSVVLTPGLLLVSPCTLSYTTAYLFCVPHLLAALFNLPSGASCRNGYTTATFGTGPGMRPMPGLWRLHPLPCMTIWLTAYCSCSLRAHGKPCLCRLSPPKLLCASAPSAA